MRTTLAIDDDVLNAAKAIAARKRMTTGEVISELARRSINEVQREAQPAFRNGIRLLPNRGDAIVTTELINALRDELP